MTTEASPKKSWTKTFATRSATASFFVLVMIGAILAGQIWFMLLFGLINLLGLWEFYKLSEKGENQPQKYYGVFAGMVLYTTNALQLLGWIDTNVLAINIPVLFFIFISELFLKRDFPFRNIGFTILGIAYVSLPITLLARLVHIQEHYNPHLILAMYFIIWANDTGAYLIGSMLGRKKLFERISPNKSWEGTIGGALTGIVVSYFLSLYYLELQLTHWIFIAIIVAITGTLGDLVESLYKRSKNVKDSGNILPGHGGILDRFDSLILSTPFVYTYLVLVCG